MEPAAIKVDNKKIITEIYGSNKQLTIFLQPNMLQQLQQCNHAIQYFEAIPLWKAMTKVITKALFMMFRPVGIPMQILTDQGTSFMSQLMADLYHTLKIKQLWTSVYHPQTDGLIECFNQTLKKKLLRVMTEDAGDWDLMASYVLFGVREVPEIQLGSPGNLEDF